MKHEFSPNVSTEFSEFSDQIFVEKKSLLKPTTIDLHTLVVTTCQSDGLRTLLRVKLLTSDLGRMIYPPSSPPTQSKNFLCTTSTSLLVRIVPPPYYNGEHIEPKAWGTLFDMCAVSLKVLSHTSQPVFNIKNTFRDISQTECLTLINSSWLFRLWTHYETCFSNK